MTEDTSLEIVYETAAKHKIIERKDGQSRLSVSFAELVISTAEKVGLIESIAQTINMFAPEETIVERAAIGSLVTHLIMVQNPNLRAYFDEAVKAVNETLPKVPEMAGINSVEDIVKKMHENKESK